MIKYNNSIAAIILLLSICVVNSTPSVTVSPSVLGSSNEILTINWAGLNATKNDIVAIYSPSTSSITHPNGYVSLQNYPNWKSGVGQLSLPILNVREDYIFRVWTPAGPNASGPTLSNIFPNVTLVVAATSTIVTFSNPNAPGKSYISLTNNTSEMRLMYVSGTNNTPTVYFDTQPTNMRYTATGTSITYSITDMCASPANNTYYFRDPGYTHDIVMTNLLPGTTYYYYFGSEADGWSKVQTFQSAPDYSVGPKEAFVVCFGDLGTNFPFTATVETQYSSSQTVAGILGTVSVPANQSPMLRAAGVPPTEAGNSLPPFWITHHVGDISYARGKAFIWDYYLDNMEPITSSVPYMLTIGNHEYDFTGQPFAPAWSNYGTDSGGECGVPFSKRFHMPGDEQSPNRNNWFSYNNGPVHFTVMSAEHDFLPGSEQFEWLVNDLASVDRTDTPWIVFSGHRPMYVSAFQGNGIGITNALLESIEPLFIKYDVNVALWGHVHVYERTCGMYNFTCAATDNDATVHVVIGNAGNSFSVPWYATDLNSQGDGHEEQPDWSIFRGINYGFSRFYANTTNLYFEFVGNHRYQVHDSFWLTSKY